MKEKQRERNEVGKRIDDRHIDRPKKREGERQTERGTRGRDKVGRMT